MASWRDRIRGLFTPTASGSSRVSTEQYATLARWIATGGHDVAHKAIVGRQGCNAAETAMLRKEFAGVRERIIEHGGSVHEERTPWQELIDKRDQRAPLDEVDLLRLVLIGELSPIRDQLRTLSEELSNSVGMNNAPNHHRHALALVIDWALTDRFDRARVRSIVAATIADKNPEWAIETMSSEVGWLLLFEPSELGDLYVRHQKQRLAAAKKRWRRGDDGDTDEAMELDIRKDRLQRAVVDGWKASDVSGLAAMFETFVRETFSYWNVEELLLAVAVGEQLTASSRSAEAALQRLCAYIPESLDPPAQRELSNDPALTALDSIDAVLARGAGLTICSSDAWVSFLAEPQQTDPDFF